MLFSPLFFRLGFNSMGSSSDTFRQPSFPLRNTFTSWTTPIDFRKRIPPPEVPGLPGLPGRRRETMGLGHLEEGHLAQGSPAGQGHP